MLRPDIVSYEIKPRIDKAWCIFGWRLVGSEEVVLKHHVCILIHQLSPYVIMAILPQRHYIIMLKQKVMRSSELPEQMQDMHFGLQHNGSVCVTLIVGSVFPSRCRQGGHERHVNNLKSFWAT
jgi:hypothetical protein